MGTVEPVLRFSNFNKSFHVVEIGSVFSFKQGVQCGVELHLYEPADGLVRFIRIIDLTQPSEPPRFIQDPGTVHHISNDDLFMVRYGVPGLVGLGYSGVIANNLFRLIPLKGASVHPPFYKSVFEAKKDELALISGSSTMPAINFSSLRTLKVPNPSLPEQRKIADFLTAVDGRIEQLSQKKALLEGYKKGVMQQLFTQALRFKDDDGNDFPDWEEKTLEEIASFHRGSALAKADLIEDGEFPCIHYGELFTRYTEVIREIFSRTNVRGGVLSRIGDILMPSSDVTPDGLAKASSLGLADIVLGGDINIIRPSRGINSEFLSYLINFQRGAIIRLVTGTTVKHLYNRDLATLILTFPSCRLEQTKIAAFLSVLDSKIESIASQLAQIKTFKKGLLQQMFV